MARRSKSLVQLDAGLTFGTDVLLTRYAANVLKIDGALRTVGDVSVNAGAGDAASGAVVFPRGSIGYNGSALAVSDSGTSKDFRVELASTVTATFKPSGILELPVQGVVGGLLIGGDVNLYRSLANILKTDDAFIAESLEASSLKITGGTPADGKVLTSDASGNGTWQAASSVPIEAWRTIGAGGEPAFQSGFSAWSAAFAPQFRKRPDGIVELRGLVKSTPGASVGTTIFTLPTGYHPTGVNGGERYFSTSYQSAAGTVYVRPDVDGSPGQVVVGTTMGASSWVSLDNIRFPTDQTTFPTGPQGPTGATGPAATLPPQVVKQWDGAHGSAAVANTLGLLSGGHSSFALGTAAAKPVSWWGYSASEWAVSGKTTEWAVKVNAGRNAVAPGGNWIFGMWQLTSAGGTGGVGVISYTGAGAIKTGPRALITGFTGGAYSVLSPWMTAAAAGWADGDILIGCVNTSATTATNSYTTYSVQLLVRWV